MSGYYGYNGKVNGVVVTYGEAKDATALQTFYDNNKSKTDSW